MPNTPRATPLQQQLTREAMQLRAALVFDDDDLEANRAGRLSEGQRQRFLSIHRPAPKDNIYLWWGAVGPLFFIAIFVGGLNIAPNPSDTWGTYLHALGFATLLGSQGIFASAYSVWLWHKSRKPLSAEGDGLYALPVEGTVSYGWEHVGIHARKTRRHYITLLGRRFDVSEQVARAFLDGRRYIVYFVYWQQVPVLLSAEPRFSYSGDRLH